MTRIPFDQNPKACPQSGRQAFLPVEARNGLSFLFLPSEQKVSVLAPVCSPASF